MTMMSEESTLRKSLLEAWADKLLLGLLAGDLLFLIYNNDEIRKSLLSIYIYPEKSGEVYAIWILLLLFWVRLHKAQKLQWKIFTVVKTSDATSSRYIPTTYASVATGITTFVIANAAYHGYIMTPGKDSIILAIIFSPFLVLLALILFFIAPLIFISWIMQAVAIGQFCKFLFHKFMGETSENDQEYHKTHPQSISLLEFDRMEKDERILLLEEWITTEFPKKIIDFYDRSALVERMTERLTNNDTRRGQVLFGEYGSGKTTVIRQIEEKLKKDNEWIMCLNNTWGKTEEPEHLIEIIIENIINSISQAGIEVSNLLSLPQNYVKAAYTGHSQLSYLFLLNHPKSSIEVIRDINQTLALHNKHLLICIEDLDRIYNVQKTAPAIMGFLDEIGREKSSNIRFIFTLGRTEASVEFVNKTADYIEDLTAPANYQLLRSFFELCNKKEKETAPNVIHLDREYEHDNQWPMIEDPAKLIYLSRYLRDARTTKRVLRTTLEIFIKLQGNATLSDILKIQIMRDSSELAKIYKNLMPDKRSTSEKIIDPKNKGTNNNMNPKESDLVQSNSTTDPEILAKNFFSELPFITNGGRGYGLTFIAPDNRSEIINVSRSENNLLQEFLCEFERLAKNPLQNSSEKIIKWNFEKIPSFTYAKWSPLSMFGTRYLTCRFYYIDLLEHFFSARYPEYEKTNSANNPVSIYVLEALTALKAQLECPDMPDYFDTESLKSKTNELFDSWQNEIEGYNFENGDAKEFPAYTAFLTGCRWFWAKIRDGNDKINDERENRNNILVTRDDLEDARKELKID
jgi:GTPase SAR1 family protein